MTNYLVRSRDRVLAVYHSITAAERYYMICGCYNDSSIYIAREDY